ncbi:MAG: phosphate ABC transporter substrate-binding protein [Chitinispirillaceae bacterium]|nr:phosphate ABC transporter substrate-binding protein [Chitinispirillaceae bacterium]
MKDTIALWHNFAARVTFKQVALGCLCAMLPCVMHCHNGKKSGAASAVTIQVKGSDTMVNIAQAWAEAYKAVAPEVEIEVSGGGSGVGIAALIKGAIEIANASRDIKDEERDEVRKNTGKEPVEFTVGYDALAVFVHKDNPVDSLSIDDLDNIYKEGASVTRWSQLSVSIPGVRSDDIVRVSRQSSSGTYEFFREVVLQKRDFKLGSCDMNGSKEVTELVATTRTAIGYSGMGYVTPHVKMLSIKKCDTCPACAPNIESTLNHTYPLARSLHMYTLGEPKGAIKKYLDWILSDDGQKIVEENGFVPIKLLSPPGKDTVEVAEGKRHGNYH